MKAVKAYLKLSVPELEKVIDTACGKCKGPINPCEDCIIDDLDDRLRELKGEQAEYHNTTPVHPGEYLGEVIKEKSISAEELAEKCGVHTVSIKHIIEGKSDIHVLYAVEFERILGIKRSIWMNMQTEFDKNNGDNNEG